jgi:hypothetical protein
MRRKFRTVGETVMPATAKLIRHAAQEPDIHAIPSASVAERSPACRHGRTSMQIPPLTTLPRRPGTLATTAAK